MSKNKNLFKDKKKTLVEELQRLRKANQFVQTVATVVALGYVLTIPPAGFQTIE